MSINGTIEFITESTTFMSMGDVIAIIVACISLIGVIISTSLTNRTTKKINEFNAELQEKWNQKNIDASLTASARIEWIQNVRNTTVELIMCYFDILNNSDFIKVEQALIESQQKTELLALYFGPEKHKQEEPFRNNDILLNTENNEGKNDILVAFIMNLAKQFSDYSLDVQNDRFNYLKDVVQKARNEMYQNATEKIIGYNYTEDGDEFPEYDIEYQEEDVVNVARAEITLKEETKKIIKLRNDLIFLRNVMRIYLKIEWNKAKDGQ